MTEPTPAQADAAEAAGLSTRPVGPGDEAFMLETYASSRRDETALMNWSAEQLDGFLRMQFQAQRADYERRFPESAHEIILHQGRPAGRLWTARIQGELRLLDIVLLEPYRRQGLATALIRRLQCQAAELGLALRLAVWKAHEHVIRFYQRLDFVPAGDMGIYLQMEWQPPEHADGRPDETTETR